MSRERLEAARAAGDEAGQRESLEAVWEAVCRLEEVQREVMWLRFGAGLSYRQMADALGIAEGTVRSRLHYAKQAMRAALEADRRPALDAREGA